MPVSLLKRINLVNDKYKYNLITRNIIPLKQKCRSHLSNFFHLEKDLDILKKLYNNSSFIFKKYIIILKAIKKRA